MTNRPARYLRLWNVFLIGLLWLFVAPIAAQEPKGTANVDMENAYGSEQAYFAMGNGPASKPRPVELTVEAIDKELLETVRVVLVDSDATWYHHPIRLTDNIDLTRRQLARAIFNSIEKDPGLDGSRVINDNGELHLRYSRKGYQAYGKYLATVIKRLEGEAETLSQQRAEQRADELLETSNSDGSDFDVLMQTDDAFSDYHLWSASQLSNPQQRYQLEEQRAASLARQLRSEQGSSLVDITKLDKLEADLRASVKTAFHLRLSLQREQLDQAQQKLNASQSRLEQRAEQADAIIDRRVSELLAPQNSSLRQ